MASGLSRGLRFFLVAALLYWLGPPLREFIEERLALVLGVVGVLGVLVHSHTLPGRSEMPNWLSPLGKEPTALAPRPPSAAGAR